MFAVVAKLLIYHTKIILKNLTTYQEIKKTYLDDIDFLFRRYYKNYFSRGVFSEIYLRLFKKPFTAFFQPHGEYISNYIYESNLVCLYLKQQKENVAINKGEINPINTININIPVDENFHHKRHSTNVKSKTASNEIKLQPGEIYYSENAGDMDNHKIGQDYQNNVFLTSSREISKNDDTLNRKIFSIINSSGTEEDENSGINIVVQNPNMFLELESNKFNNQVSKTNVNINERIKRLPIENIVCNQNVVSSDDDIMKNLDDKENNQNKPLTDRDASQRTRKEDFSNLKTHKLITLLSSSIIREIKNKNSLRNYSLSDGKIIKGNFYSEENVSEN